MEKSNRNLIVTTTQILQIERKRKSSLRKIKGKEKIKGNDL